MSRTRIMLYLTLLIMLLKKSYSSYEFNLPEYTTFPEGAEASTLKELVKGLGLGYSKYVVETEDGYLLTLNRIKNPALPKKGRKGFPVLMVNGLFMHADSWLLHSKPEHNPAIAFLRAGYDIWLGDQRGTMRSLGHRNTTSDHKVFWDFSFHEIGKYDLPAFIEFVLRKTHFKKLIYVGNSLGTTFSYVLLSERPEYNKKMFLVLSIMPVGILPYIETRPQGVQAFYIFLKTIMAYYLKVGAGCIRDIPLLRKQIRITCESTPNLSLWQSEMISGPGMHPDMENNRFCHQSSLQCGGASAKTIIHVLQLYETGKFTKYSHGEDENMVRYKQPFPPMYNLHNVRVPLAAYYSNTDSYSPSETVTIMLSKFQGHIYRCEMRNTHHVDALFGTQFHNFVPDMVEVLHSATGRTSIAKLKSGQCPPYNVTWRQ